MIKIKLPQSGNQINIELNFIEEILTYLIIEDGVIYTKC